MRGRCGSVHRDAQCNEQTKPVSLTMASLGDAGRSKPTVAAAWGL